MSATPRTDALLAEFRPSVPEMTPLGQVGRLYQALHDTERELAHTRAVLRAAHDTRLELSLALKASVATAEQLRAALDKCAFIAKTERDEAYGLARVMLVADAALSVHASNPNPSGQSRAEASSATAGHAQASVGHEASGPVGLGPNEEVTCSQRSLIARD